MSFLNFAMLAGIAAVAVPILIHLLNRRKYEKVVWAAMRFIQSAVEQNRRRLQIEDLLLLLMRCAIIALLALALARPTIHAASALGMFGGGGVTAVIALDNSFSMSGTDGVSSRFNNAKKAAGQLIESLPAGSSVAVILASDIADAVIPEPTSDLNLAKATILQARLSDRSTNLLPAFRQSLDVLKRKASGRREFYLVTDGQRSGWTQMPDIRKLLDDAHDQISTRVVLVGPDVRENLALTDLHMASGLSPVDRPLRFEAAVANYGATEAKDVRVQLRLDAKPPAAGAAAAASFADAAVDEATIDSLPAGTTRVVSLFGKIRSGGAHAVTVSIPGDRLPADDNRTIVTRGLTGVKVLIVDGDTATATEKTGGFFLKNALLPIPANEVEHYFVSVTTVPASALSTQRFDGFDAVCMTDVPDFDPAVVDALADYVRRGGGLVIFPGPNTGVASYNTQLFQRTHLLPTELGAPRGEAGQEKTFLTLQAKNFEHPIASIWNDPAAGTPAAAHFFRSFTLIPETPAPNAPADANAPQVVLRYTDATPAVMERPVGLGRVVLFSSTADTTWCDLPVRPGIFVPLMYRTLGSIVSRQDESLNVNVGQRFLYRTSTDLLGREVTITTPAGGKDSQRVELSGANAIIQCADTASAGAYDVAVTAPEPLNLKFAALRDKNESRLEALSSIDLRIIGENAQVVQWRSDAPLDQTMRTARAGRELWTPIALCVLALVVAETFLGNRFSQPK